MSSQKSRHTNSWDVEIPVAGSPVTILNVDFGFGLGFQKDSTSIRIETPFTLWIEGEEWTITPGDVESLYPALKILQKTVGRAVGRADGTLEIDFTDGTRLRVPPDPSYEAWTAGNKKGLLLVSFPGGGLAIWNEREPGNDNPVSQSGGG